MTTSILDQLLTSGAARARATSIGDLPDPLPASGSPLSELLDAARDAER